MTWDRAQALFGAGILAHWQGDFQLGGVYETAGYGLFQMLNDAEWTAFAKNMLGVLSNRRGKPEVAEQLWRESLAMFRAPGNTMLAALVLNNLGDLAMRQARYEQAKLLLEESLLLLRESPNATLMQLTLGSLGDLALVQGIMP